MLPRSPLGPISGLVSALGLTLLCGCQLVDNTIRGRLRPLNPASITPLADQALGQGGSTNPLSFTVSGLSDELASAPCTSVVSPATDNVALVPLPGIILAGTVPDCTVSVVAAATGTGIATLTLSVPSGNRTASVSFKVFVFASTNSISFAGIDNIDSLTDSTATVHWTHVPAAIAYQIFDTTSGTPVFVAFVAAPTASYDLTGLTPAATYKFRVKAQSSSGLLDVNTNDVPITMNAAPTPPSGLALQSPTMSPDFDTTPTIRVSGVKSGDTVRLFTDSGCLTEVGSATAAGSTVDITSSALTPNSYTFYANATKVQASACSTASVAYTLTECPTGFIPVPGNATLGTSNFCVMQYEAKAWVDSNMNGIVDASEVDSDGCGEPGCTTANWAPPGTYKPVSQEADLPWRRIDQDNARLACEALNTPPATNFDLISNPEWMTLARNIETQPSNWTSGTVGVGSLFQGNNGTDAGSSYNGSDPEGGASRNTKARHTLSNNETIWDLSGNVWEWVDWNVTPDQKAYVSADGSPQSAWREFTALNMLIELANEMFPNSWQPTNPSYNSAQGIGRYYAGNNASGGAALRGGSWYAGTGAGVFAVHLSNSSTFTDYHDFGFRCVFRP